MTEKAQTPAFLVSMNGEESASALAYAAAQARAAGGRVALLYVVEAQEIEAWGGVEKAMADEAFARARQDLALRAKGIEALSGAEPLAFYRKGERRAALLELIESEPSIVALVVAGHAKDGSNALLQYLVSDKGIKKLSIPLIVVPEVFRGGWDAKV